MSLSIFIIHRYSVHNFEFAYGLVRSRSFKLKGRTVLVPGVDLSMFHVAAYTDYAVHLSLASLSVGDGGDVCLVAEKDYTPGEQLMLTYLGLSNPELVRKYGITVHPNKDNHLDLWLPLASALEGKEGAEKDAAESMLLAAIKMAGVPAELVKGHLHTTVAIGDDFPHNPLVALRLITAAKEGATGEDGIVVIPIK